MCYTGMCEEVTIARSFRIESTVRVHHVYKTHWSPSIGEELCCEVEEDNTFDRYAVAVTKDGRVVRPRTMRADKNLLLLFEEAAQHDDLYSHGQEEAVGYQWKRPRSAMYLHFQRQRKARLESDILFHLATCLPILYLFHILLYVFHTSFSKTILHTLVYARHVHELQTAKPWAGRGGAGGAYKGAKIDP